MFKAYIVAYIRPRTSQLASTINYCGYPRVNTTLEMAKLRHLYLFKEDVIINAPIYYHYYHDTWTTRESGQYLRYNGNITYKGPYSINPSSCNDIGIYFKVLYFYYIFSFFSWIYAKLYENMYFLFKISLRQKIMPILTYLSQSSILLRNAQRIGGYEERSVVAYFTKERL